MKLFAKNIENEILYIKNYKQPSFEQISSSLDDLVEKYSSNRLDKYTDDIWMLDGGLIKNKNSIPSAYSVTCLASKKQNYLQKLFSETPIKLSKNRSFKSDDRESAKGYFNEIVKAGPITLSPNDPSSPQAITQITEMDEFLRNWDILAKRYRSLTIENSLSGDCFKLYILRGELVAVYGVVPAFVVGDGKSNIATLIQNQNHARAKNVFYSAKPIVNIGKSIDQQRIPQVNEIVRLKRTHDLTKGAIFFDLTNTLFDRYSSVVQALDKVLIDAMYVELTCYSDDFSAGLTHSSFFVRDVKFNTADVRELFACVIATHQIQDLLEKFNKDSYSEELEECKLDKSPIFENTTLDSATQIAILKEAGYRLGLGMVTLDKGILEVSNHSTWRNVRFLGGMSSRTTSVARDASNNKYLTKQLLDRAGISTPRGFRVDIGQRDDAWSKAKSFQAAVVVKPLNGSGGVGVTTDITTKRDFENAWQICEDLGSKIVLVEENVSGNDYRIIVIGNKVCAVTQRIAAYVVGDGQRTIKELIDIKAEERISNPFYRTKKFEENDVMVHYLKKQNKTLEYIPSAGDKVQLLDAVNIGSGGESIDRTDEIHPAWVKVAVKARKAILNSYHVGLDLMAESISRPPHEQNWSIIEVNTNPELGLQLFPGTGHPRDVGATLLKEILGECIPDTVCYTMKIQGKVQGVGYRKWFQQLCNLRSVVGYVKNTDDPTAVEALIVGPEVTVNGVLADSYVGPQKATVRSIVIEREHTCDLSKYNQMEIYKSP